ncbi:EAL domain-containing protein [Rhizobium herbae]|jgi:sensor c-di-GMP phosphodiesterase-like protein
MDRRRSRIIAVAVFLAFLGAAIPIAAMAYMSWVIAIERKLDRLELFSRVTLLRATNTFTDAKGALDAIAATSDIPCSETHIGRMRALTVNTRSIEEMGYFADGLLKCTSWGRTAGKITKSGVDYVTPDGIDVTIRMRPAVSGGKPMMALHSGSYNVLVAPSRFMDVLLDDGMSIALANEEGAIINTLNAPDPKLVRSVVAEPRKGMSESDLFAAAHGGGLLAVATQPKSKIGASLRTEQMLLLPVGVFIAAFIVAVVIWLSRKRLSPLAELEIAVRNHEFIVHYQPIVELKTGICVGAEALVRWRRPDGSLVSPDLFIPLAEQSGLIKPITDQVIKAVILDLNSMLVEDRTLHIAINLCAADIKSGRILDVLEDRLANTDIRPQQIWLEATERGFMDIDAARVTLAKARERGHSVAIDDFGTGYSSLQYLQRLPLDALKIDKSFIDTIGRDTATSSVTSHIIDMSKSLGLFSVAEGVETEDQADYLKAHGVDFGQGWLFSKALPADDFVAYHRRTKEKYGSAPEVIQAAAE